MYLNRWMTGHDVPEIWREKFEQRYDEAFYRDNSRGRGYSGRSESKEAA
tara:strand:+ start:271 stop:417 length:147 start_codon:yes stop_codon:yes gene_type:complete